MRNMLRRIIGQDPDEPFDPRGAGVTQIGAGQRPAAGGQPNGHHQGRPNGRPVQRPAQQQGQPQGHPAQGRPRGQPPHPAARQLPTGQTQAGQPPAGQTRPHSGAPAAHQPGGEAAVETAAPAGAQRATRHMAAQAGHGGDGAGAPPPPPPSPADEQDDNPAGTALVGPGRALQVIDQDDEALLDLVQIPPTVRDKAYFDRGTRTLYIAATYEADGAVYSFEQSLRGHGVFYDRKVVSLERIKGLQIDAERASITVGNERLARERAREILLDAARRQTSDIHFNMVKGKFCEVGYRVDGHYVPIRELGPEEGQGIIAVLYIAGTNKNESEWRMDQDCFALIDDPEMLHPSTTAIRYTSTGTYDGCKTVLRLLGDRIVSRGRENDDFSIHNIGFSPEQVEILTDMARAANGMNIISGPTGSGKSSTQKYVMEWLRQIYPNMTRLTVEDPPEYKIVGASQIPVLIQEDNDDPKARARRYAATIATTLRLDPNIIMVGEVRDGASASALVRAAQTGHKLWSTLHTNDAWGIINRMTDLLREDGVLNPMSLIADVQNMSGMMAQRLMPTLCPHCKVRLINKPNALGGPESPLHRRFQAALGREGRERWDEIYVRGPGCDTCVPEHAGNREKQMASPLAGGLGRTLVAELIRPNQMLLDIVAGRGVPAARYKWLEQGGRTMVDNAIAKCLDGTVSPELVEEFVGQFYSAQQLLDSYRDIGPTRDAA